MSETSPSPYLIEGARLLAQGDYFLSHETLEEHWVEAPPQDRDLLQALIHVAVGLLHHEKGNLKGARLQFGKAAARLDGYPQTYEGVDVASVRSFCVAALGSAGSEKLIPPVLLCHGEVR